MSFDENWIAWAREKGRDSDERIGFAHIKEKSKTEN